MTARKGAVAYGPSRAERAMEVGELRDRGLTGVQIAERLGLSRSYAYELLNDPDGSAVRRRKDRYRGECEECGAPTDGSNGTPGRPRRCRACNSWTPELIIAQLRKWARTHGEPPRERDWRLHLGEPGHRAPWPSEVTVVKHFGSWNFALLAAGFELHRDTRPETQDAIMAALRAGETVRVVADRFGVTVSAIYMRLSYRGLSIHDVRSGNGTR